MEEKTAQKLVKAMERLCRSVGQLAEERPDYDNSGCDFCTALKNANRQNKELGVPPVCCELNGARTSFRYCPECGRKL